MTGSKEDSSIGTNAHHAYDENERLRQQRDSATLAQMGKKQVLKRKFGAISILAFSCTILCTWEGIMITFAQGFANGGTLGVIGQFVMAWGGTLSTFMAIGELASMAPTAAGQYYWVAMLSPRSMRKFLSYLTGWMTCLAWVITITTGAYWIASMIQTLCVLDYPDYAPHATRWQVTLMSWGVILMIIFINTITGKFLPHFEATFLIVHILGFFGILFPLIFYSEKRSVSEVFAEPWGHLNSGGWSTYGVSFMVGSFGCTVSFVGADAAVHMSEEIVDASINVPRSIFFSVITNGILGFAMLIAVLFCMGSPEAVSQAMQTSNYPIIEIFVSATHSVAGATVMTTILVFMLYAASTGAVATASRMIWSFARDEGLPFSKYIRTVSTEAKIPIVAVIVGCTIPCLLELINIGSTTVYEDVASLSMAGFYSTYFVSCLLLLINRFSGRIHYAEPDHPLMPAYKNKETDEYVLTWGPWHLPGVLGTINNIIAVCYLATIWVFAFFPPSTPTTASTMNFASAVWGGTMAFSVLYYIFFGRYQYTGPIVEISTS